MACFWSWSRPNPSDYAHEQVGRHAPVDPTVLQIPDVEDYDWPERDERELRVKHGGAHSSIFYRNNPMNIVG
jgi:homogentisate 1,2-dioxygenase